MASNQYYVSSPSERFPPKTVSGRGSRRSQGLKSRGFTTVLLTGSVPNESCQVVVEEKKNIEPIDEPLPEKVVSIYQSQTRDENIRQNKQMMIGFWVWLLRYRNAPSDSTTLLQAHFIWRHDNYSLKSESRPLFSALSKARALKSETD